MGSTCGRCRRAAAGLADEARARTVFVVTAEDGTEIAEVAQFSKAQRIRKEHPGSTLSTRTKTQPRG